MRILLEEIPAFALERSRNDTSLSHELDLPYLVYGDFGFFLRDVLETTTNSPDRENLLRQGFDLLSEMLTSSDPKIVNLAEVGVFEILSEKPDTLTTARNYLTDEAREVVNEWTD
ncbi:MAG: hypothetical protein WAQ99_13090 [Pyrinomonadaceae bacterium]